MFFAQAGLFNHSILLFNPPSKCATAVYIFPVHNVLLSAKDMYAIVVKLGTNEGKRMYIVASC